MFIYNGLSLPTASWSPPVYYQPDPAWYTFPQASSWNLWVHLELARDSKRMLDSILVVQR